ncbi:LppX_LprAFG lipoprotein [Kineococcus sp. T13]|uniref:LppX_LprAFG lipoprotein n=1 Tax=Kineococcus vitellinus TaxID=2696565 RepID=UPI00141343CC|nr:LppX_LprAFG lipoprotein [Kineococcus vitellinus]NAZ74390.1 LppX_LprAFG lipoprotein [Kineococcus vitellinus]
MTTSHTASSSRPRRRRLGALAAGGAAVLALGLGACSGGDDAAAPAASTATASPATQLTAFQAVQASAQQSKEAGSAKFSLAVAGTAEGQAVEVSGDGAFDAATGAFEMKVALPAQAGGMSLTMRLVDGTAYVSGAPLTAEGQWLKMPLDAMAAGGLDTSAMDPTKALEQLQAVAEDVREVPGQTVRGVEAKGYAGTIDVAKAMELLPPEQRTADASAAAEQIGDIPFTLYVDEQDRPVRMSEQITVEGATMDVTMDYYDWGSEVDVAAPDPATVTEAPAFDGTATGTAPAAAA